MPLKLFYSGKKHLEGKTDGFYNLREETFARTKICKI